MEKKWWQKSVVYQIYPRSFCDSDGDGIGDLNGITGKLEYLKHLGVDVIWLSPIYKSPNVDNGYDISDYQDIMDEFGTMEDFDRMLARAHELGLKIMMDLVVNHTSDQHAWFKESRKDKENPYRDFYFWKEGRDGKAPNNWGAVFGGSAWQYDETTDMYYMHMFAPQQPDLNWDNPKVRDAVFEMMTWWCDKGIDGFRMDVIDHISKTGCFDDGVAGKNGYGDYGPFVINGPHLHDYLREMNERVLSRYDLITVGECGGATVEQAKKYASLDGKELNMVFQFEHTNLDRDNGFKWTDKKMSLPELKKVLSRWQNELYGKAWNSLYWCNHDQPRIVSRLGNDSSEYRELSAKMLATCLHMMQGTPYVYQGEELGMTNYPFAGPEDFRDVESINAYETYTENGDYTPEEMLRLVGYRSRDNSRTPMQWDDGENAGFTTGHPWMGINPNHVEINAAEQVKRPDSVFNYYKKLIALRKEMDIIVYGDYRLLMPESETVFAYMRQLDGQKLLVACNFSQEAVPFALPEDIEMQDATVLISNYDDASCGGELTLRPYEAVVLYSQG